MRSALNLVVCSAHGLQLVVKFCVRLRSCALVLELCARLGFCARLVLQLCARLRTVRKAELARGLFSRCALVLELCARLSFSPRLRTCSSRFLSRPCGETLSPCVGDNLMNLHFRRSCCEPSKVLRSRSWCGVARVWERCLSGLPRMRVQTQRNSQASK